MTSKARLALIAATVAILTGFVATGARASTLHRPVWVTSAILDIRREFIGMPRPVSVRWKIGAAKRWVTVRFPKVEICGLCSAPSRDRLPRGRIATMFFDLKTGAETDFGVLP